MIVASVRMVISPEERQKVADLIRPIIEPTLVQPGCAGCRIYQDFNNQNILTYEEVWQNQETLERHLCSEMYENILAAIDLASQEPEIHFNTVSYSGGFEVICAARRSERM